MDELDKANYKDAIIQFLATRTNSENYDVKTISSLVFKNKISEVQTRILLKEIVEHNSDMISVWNRNCDVVEKSEYTQEYSNYDHFKSVYERELAEELGRDRALFKEHEAKRVAREKDKVQLTLAKWQKKTFIPVFIFGLLGGCYSLYKIITPSNNVQQEQYDTKIESIEKELQQLRIDFKQENDELKDRLYKAELLIAVYEGE